MIRSLLLGATVWLGFGALIAMASRSYLIMSMLVLGSVACSALLVWGYRR